MTKFNETGIAKFMSILMGDSFTQSLTFFKSSSEPHHNLAMLSLYNQKRIQIEQKSVHSGTSYLNAIDVAFKLVDARSSRNGVVSAFKALFDPINEFFVGVRHLYEALVIGTTLGISNAFGVVKTDEETTFSIDNARKVCEFQIGVHNHSYVNRKHYDSTLNRDKGHVERLNEKAPIGRCDSLTMAYA